MPGYFENAGVVMSKMCDIADVQSHFEKNFMENYSLMLINDKVLPTISCDNCHDTFYMWKWSKTSRKIYTNTVTNVLNHAKCRKGTTNHTRIDVYSKIELPDSKREEFAYFIASQVSQFNTLSINSATKFANNIARFATEKNLGSHRLFNYNISRQNVSAKLIEMGQSKLEAARKYFEKNYRYSAVVFDHWSKGGYNFIGIIARIAEKDFKITNKVISFSIASSNKSATGIYDNLIQFIHIDICPLPIISDNCSAMIAAIDGHIYKNQRNPREGVYKIYCLEHKLSVFDEKVHSHFLSEIDNQITKINAFYNYRHKRYISTLIMCLGNFLSTDLELKPSQSISTTRPWRSFKKNYSTTIRNYSAYLAEKNQNSLFPELPDLDYLKTISEYQNTFCEAFDKLEANDSDLKTGIEVFFELKLLSKSASGTEAIRNELNKFLDEEFFQYAFSDIAVGFFYLTRSNITSNYINSLK